MNKPSRAIEIAFSKVTEVTLGFWFIKILATTLGETGGDAVSMSLNLGYAISSPSFILIFIVAVLAQIRARAFHPFLYWFVIIATTTAGTTMADFADRSLGVGYPGGASTLFVLLIASFGVWYWAAGSISVKHRQHAQNRELLLGRDPVLADAWHCLGRLDGGHQWARL